MNGAAYDVHPYLHLNYQGDYQSLSVYVHEWGHAVHTAADHRKSAVREFELLHLHCRNGVRTANEMLLSDYMVAHAKDNQEKLTTSIRSWN